MLNIMLDDLSRVHITTLKKQKQQHIAIPVDRTYRTHNAIDGLCRVLFYGWLERSWVRKELESYHLPIYVIELSLAHHMV